VKGTGIYTEPKLTVYEVATWTVGVFVVVALLLLAGGIAP
jgi:hypothetical protein